MNPRFVLILLLLLVVGGGLAIGFLTAPGNWYAGLAKPAFNPPASIFAPVWTVLYTLIAIAGWAVCRRRGIGSTIMKLWWAQLVLNFLWSPIFFVAHRIGFALVIILLFVTILAFIVMAWERDRAAASLFVPYAAWVAFAFVLNASLFVLN